VIKESNPKIDHRRKKIELKLIFFKVFNVKNKNKKNLAKERKF